MMAHKRWLPVAVLLAFVSPTVSGQGSMVTPAQAGAFMGTWTFAMTEPPNSEQTVRVWDKNGIVGASLQISKFPPNEATGILKDGDVLILTTTVRENGVPIWAVVALKRDGNTMVMSQMIQHSPVVKRGTGKREAD